MCGNKNAAAFLDRDGTLIEDVGHLKDPSDVVFFPGTLEALRKIQKHFLLFIVTNQPGVAEAVISRKDVNRVNIHLMETLAKAGIEITDVYVCPHRRLDNCRCIKPKPYFLKKAARLYALDLSRSITIGDHPHDIQLAKNAGARGIYVLTGHGQKHLTELPEDTEIAPGITAAAELIVAHHTAIGRRRRLKQIGNEFVLDLMVAHDLWWRPDLGPEPEHAREVARVLREVGIKVYKVSGGWLECELRPIGIWEALTGRSAPPDWARQSNCLLEQPGQVLKILADKQVDARLLGSLKCRGFLGSGKNAKGSRGAGSLSKLL